MTSEPDDPMHDDADDPLARLIRLGGPRQEAPDDRRARVRARVHGLWSATARRDRRRRLVLAVLSPLAAALILAVGAGLWLRQRGPVGGSPVATVERADGRVRLPDGRDATPGRTLAAGARLTTGLEGRAALRLVDGPAVRLDVASDLHLISAHLLELRHGAIYVDSGARPSGGSTPVEIRTHLARVRDVGTQFEVRLAGDRLRVSVREGVAVVRRGRRTYDVPAGKSLRLSRGGEAETGSLTLQPADWDWVLAVAPAFELEGRTLREYLDWLSRETGWVVRFSDPAVGANAAAVTLHGSTSGLRPDRTPEAVLPPCGLRHRLEDGTLILERASGQGEPR